MPDQPKPYCCFIPNEAREQLKVLVERGAALGDQRAYLAKVGCKNEPKWEVHSGSWDPYSVTQACGEHVSEMLDGEFTSTVWPIDMPNKG